MEKGREKMWTGPSGSNPDLTPCGDSLCLFYTATRDVDGEIVENVIATRRIDDLSIGNWTEEEILEARASGMGVDEANEEIGTGIWQSDVVTTRANRGIRAVEFQDKMHVFYPAESETGTPYMKYVSFILDESVSTVIAPTTASRETSLETFTEFNAAPVSITDYLVVYMTENSYERLLQFVKKSD